LTRLLSPTPGKSLFQEIVTVTGDPTRFTQHEGDLATDDGFWIDEFDIRRQCMLVDARGFLIDDILVKVDRASMSTSLEVRSPLLDHRLVELAWRMRTSDLYEGARGKMPLRRALGRQLPPHLFERPKMGFDIPIRQWLRGPLRDWAESLIDPGRLRREGYFVEATITSMWQHYLRHQGGWTHMIWSVLMFQSWLDSRQANTSAQTA
jgi:asparagine synthase (glutamine-hydrolysing)